MADLITLQDDALAAGADPRDIANVSQDNITATGPFTSTAVEGDVPVGGEFDIDFEPQSDVMELQLADAGGTGHSYTDNVTATLVTLAEGREDEDPIQTFRNRKAALLNQSVEDIINQATQEAKTQAVANALQFADTDAEAVAQIIQEDVAALDGPMKLQEAAARALNATQSVQEKETIVRQYAGMQIAQMLNNVGMLDSVVNFGGLFIPDVRKDLSDLSEDISFFNVGEGFKQFMLDYRSLSPEEKLAQIPAIRDQLMVAFDGNEMKVASKLQQVVGLEADDSIDWELFFEGVEWALLPLEPLAKAVKGANVLKFSRDLNNAETAGELNAAALMSEEVAEGVGVKKMDAVTNISPFRWEALTPNATDGIASETVKAITDTRKAVREQIERMESERIHRGALTPEEIEAAQTKAIDKFEKQAEQLKEQFGWSASDAQITKSDTKGFTIEYTLNDDTGALTNVTPKPVRVDYTTNDLGEFDIVAANPVQTAIQSPSTWMNKISKGAVEKATVIGFTEGQLQQKLFGAYKTAVQGLGKKDIQDVDDILLAGDEAGKVYTINELMVDGVATNTGIKKLDTKQASAYFAMRDMFDGLWNAKNTQLREQMVFEGQRHVATFRGQRVIGKPQERVRQIPEGVSRIYTNEGQVKGIVDVTPELRKDLAAGRLTLYKLNNSVEGGKDVVDWALAAKDKDIPLTVMNRINGYVPLVRENAGWFVRAATPRIVNGASKEVPKTVRAFDNQTDALAWAKKEEETSGIKHTVNFDRELPDTEHEELQIKSMGGLYGSARSEREILFGFNGDRPTRMNAVESLSRNIAHISNAVPMNEFRMEMINRWLNSANRFLERPGDFNSPLKISGGSKEAVALEDSRRWILDQMRVPTPSEERWAGMMRNVAVVMEGSNFFKDGVGKSSRLAIQDLANVDPFAAARAGAFHALLGWFNPAQLLVQGTGAAVAFSLDPLRAPKVLNQGLFLRAGLFVQNDKALENIANAAGKTGLDKAEMLATIKDYKRSGLFESLKTNADYNAALNGFSVDGGAFKRAAESGLVFFREGELFARSYSWLLARDKFVRANPDKKGKALTDAEIDSITQDSLRLTLNLNRANRAEWQKGAMSIPTQFLQINAKFMEAMAPNLMGSGNWTGQEKAQVMAGQFLLFGAAGVPLGNYMFRGALEMTEGDIAPEDRDTYEQGMTGAFLSMLFGEPIEIATRTSLVSGIEQMIVNTIKGDKSVGEVLIGAAGVVPNRAIEAASDLAPILKDPVNMNWTKDEGMLIASEFGQIISTFRNAHKAYLWARMGEIQTADGQTLDTVDWGEDWRALVAQAAGFSPSRVQDAYEYQDYVKDMRNIRKDTLKAITNAHNLYLRGDVQDPKRQANFSNQMSLLLSSLPANEQMKVQEEWAKRLTDPKTVLGEAYKAALEQYIQTGDLNPSTLGKGVPLDLITTEE